MWTVSSNFPPNFEEESAQLAGDIVTISQGYRNTINVNGCVVTEGASLEATPSTASLRASSAFGRL